MLQPGQSEKYESGLKSAQELFSMDQVDLAVETLNKILPLAPDEGKAAQVHCRLGEYLMKMSDYEQAVLHLESAIVNLFSRPECLELFYAYRNIAWIYWRQGYIERSAGFAEGARSSIELRESLNDQETLLARASLHHLQGLLCGARSEDQAAEDHYRREADLLIQCGHQDRLGPVYGNICGICRLRGDYAKALDYQNQALEIARKAGDMLSVGIGYNNLGEIYHNLGAGAKAQEYFENYLEINGVIGNAVGNCFGLSGLARVFMDRGNFQEAEHALDRALEIARDIKSKSRESGILADQAVLSCKTGKPGEALEKIEQAMEINKNTEQTQSQWHLLVKAQALHLLAADYPGCLEQSRKILEEMLQQPLRADDELAFSLTELTIEARLLLAQVHRENGGKDAARSNLRQAREGIDLIASNLEEDLRKGFLSKPSIRQAAELEARLEEKTAE
ncbi:MAG: tetratricopeptide repeat protein [Deltaproteobacteria bacterium]|nr:tetratricopeptide repeat protein [Deltaproteobacteria bacterium]